VKAITKAGTMLAKKEARRLEQEAHSNASTPPHLLHRTKTMTVNMGTHDAYKKLEQRHHMDTVLEAGIFNVSSFDGSVDVYLPPFDPQKMVEIDIQMRKHIMWHTYKLRVAPTYLARSNFSGELKDTHAYAHISELKIESAEYATLCFVPYIPTVQWYFYCSDMQHLVQSIYHSAAKQGIKVHITGNQKVIESWEHLAHSPRSSRRSQTRMSKSQSIRRSTARTTDSPPASPELGPVAKPARRALLRRSGSSARTALVRTNPIPTSPKGRSGPSHKLLTHTQSAVP